MREDPPHSPPTAGETLGMGNMGVIRAATDSEGRPCAIKRPTQGSNTALARFSREIAAMGRTGGHRNLVALRASGEDADGRWLLMERIDGRSLAALGRAPRAEILLSLMRQLADAVAHCHSHQVAHRDIKPSNILIERSGRLVLLDFGVAFIEGEAPLTGDQIPGTRAYQPPEGRASGPYAADLYAMGLVFRELLSTSPTERDADPDLQRAMALTRALLDRDPERRPSAERVAAELEQYEIWPVSWDETAAAGTIGPSSGGSSEHSTGGRIGRYEIRTVLGQGGMGVVQLAYDPQLERLVAIKRINRTDPVSVERFRREAAAVARLDHPNIVRLLDFGVDDAGPFFAMSFIDGPTLAQRLADRGPPPRATAIRWLSALGSALSAAHAAGLVHRDVKPGNVLLDGEIPKLTDFGLVSGLGDALTRTDQLLGTPAYMAPEQAACESVDARTDIYALGAIAYELFSGRPPFTGDHPAAIVHRVLTEEPVPVEQLVTDLPPALAAICGRALEKDPADRYASALELVTDLQRAEVGETLAPQPLLWRKGARRLRNRARTPLLVLSIALCAGAVLLGSQRMLHHRQLVKREADAEGRLAQVQREIEARTAQGDTAGASRAFTAFAELPDLQGTDALARGWLLRAEQLDADRQTDPATEARARAFVIAPSGELQREALVALGHDMQSRRRWDGLSVVLDALDTRGLGAGIDDLRFALAVADRRLDEALAIDPGTELAPMLVALSRGTRLPFSGDITPFDIDNDGLPEAIFPIAPGHWVQVAGGKWPSDEPTDLVYGPPSLIPVGRTQAGLLALAPCATANPCPHALLQIGADPHAPRTLATFEDSPIRSKLAFARTPGDALGDDRVYVGTGSYQRNLVELAAVERASEPWIAREAHAQTSSTNSEIEGLLSADLDGSGRRLVVYSNGWGAYDIRLFDIGTEGLALVNRRKVGAIYPPVALKRLELPDRLAFVRADVPIANPIEQGDPPGIYVLDEQLQTAAQQALTSESRGVSAGDIDGDGRTDLLIAEGPHPGNTVLARQRGDWAKGEPFALARLGAVSVSAVSDVDGDGDDEVIVHIDGDDHLWVLGQGETPIPPVVRPVRAQPPAQIPSDLADAWNRAEVLAGLGLSKIAASSFEDLALLDAGEVGAQASLQAGELDQSELEQASAAYVRAATSTSDPATRTRALRAAADLFASVHRFEEAARWNEAFSKLDDASPRERQRRAQDAERQRVWGAQMPVPVALPPAAPWRMRAPLFTPSSEDKLRIQTLYAAPIAQMTLRQTGERIGVQVTVRAERIEWGSGFKVTLEADSASFGADVAAGGGNGAQTLNASCQEGSSWQLIGVSPDKRNVWSGDLVLRLDLVPREGLALCQITGEHTFPYRLLNARTASDQWRLTLSTDGLGAMLDATISEITLIGLTPVAAGSSEASPLERARGALAVSHLTEALAHAQGDELEAKMLRAAALDELGRWNEAAALFRRELLRADPYEAALMQTLIRTATTRRLSMLRAEAGPRWPLWFDAAYGVLLRQHSKDPLSRSILLDELGPLPTPDRTAPDEREVIAWLAGVRASALRGAGRTEQALADATLAAAHARASTARYEGIPVPPPAVALRELARSLAATDPDAAFRALKDALAAAPAPEILADVLCTDAELDVLHADPRWRSIVIAARHSTVDWPPE